MTAPTVTDPAARSASSWSAILAALKSRGAPDHDARVIEARQGLAFHRINRAVTADRDQLGPAGVDRLVAELRQAARR